MAGETRAASRVHRVHSVHSNHIERLSDEGDWIHYWSLKVKTNHVPALLGDSMSDYLKTVKYKSYEYRPKMVDLSSNIYSPL